MQVAKEQLRDAMTNAGVGVVKVQSVGANVACKPQEALLTQLNIILTKGDK